MLAWWLRWLELFNDLRIVILFGTGVLFTTSLMIAAWHQAAVAASLIFATLLLSLVPFLTAAKRRKQNSPLLRLLSFNIQTTNQRFREIAAFIARTNADVVIVQEVDRAAVVTGLRRHATLLATWPADKFFPAFLIDHVFATCEFFTVKVATGPFLGSDHRPIIADIGMDDPTSQR